MGAEAAGVTACIEIMQNVFNMGLLEISQCGGRREWNRRGNGTHLLTEADQHAIDVMLLDRLLLTSLANIPSFCLWACILIKCCLCHSRIRVFKDLAE